MAKTIKEVFDFEQHTAMQTIEKHGLDQHLSSGTVERIIVAMSTHSDLINQQQKERIRQLETQLAGCTVAAMGYITGDFLAKHGSYGHSDSYQHVLELRQKYDALKEAAEKDRLELLQKQSELMRIEKYLESVDKHGAEPDAEQAIYILLQHLKYNFAL